MTSLAKASGLLEATSDAFKAARRSLLAATHLLYQVREKEAYKSKYDPFSAFVEEECGISRGHASKLLTIYSHYVVEHGVLQQNLEAVDTDKLYLAIRTPGSAQQQLSRAKTLTRQELKLDTNDAEPHDHEPITICAKCHIRLNENT